jgi:hypothetical protein
MFTARVWREKDGYRENPANGRGGGPVKAKKRRRLGRGEEVVKDG